MKKGEPNTPLATACSVMARKASFAACEASQAASGVVSPMKRPASARTPWEVTRVFSCTKCSAKAAWANGFAASG